MPIINLMLYCQVIEYNGGNSIFTLGARILNTFEVLFYTNIKMFRKVMIMVVKAINEINTSFIETQIIKWLEQWQ